MEVKNHKLQQFLEDLKCTTLLKKQLKKQKIRMDAELNVAGMLQPQDDVLSEFLRSQGNRLSV